MSDSPKDPKGVFLAALEIQDPAERAALVERSCGGDAALRQRVEDLLRAYGQPDGPLEKLAAALAPTELGEPIREQVGTIIGPYKLMQQIGEGGFGLVFVAEQQQPIRRKVALKIIKPGMDTRDVIARFKAEQQALALMDHPNIARVFDAGTTESGRPYFVMELVRGIPITEYCDRSQLTPRERLELFIPVCNAIQHAHLKGIIHRDIKPSNVLVTLHDGKPVVKVIDFGVAKALHQSLTDRTIYTRFAQIIGTPLYMSPEQAEMSGLDIDTRTDVYSLGVLLYELLTGTTPFDKQRLAKAAYDELLRIIREEEPPKPSLRLSQSGDSLPSIAAQRKTEPAKLSKMFHGDLDWIAMRALEKDRTRRYETANAFAADVLRYLNEEPVEASPPSASYRLRKLARKHRTALVTAASFAGLLIAGIIVSSWLALLADRASQAAKNAERAALGSERKAIDALKQVTQERDAKEAERDRAERQLANGLLRPIGFADAPGGGPAELRSFVDWSAIKESPLKLRVLEIALENPETAIRIARRVERVIQSCVGLSPTRRAQAIKLVSIRQRDLTADPRIRVAACWLALELGSADLPAWGESCDYLADPKNESVDRFGEFVKFAAGCSEPQQVAHLDLDPLLAMLDTSTDRNVLRTLCDVLAELAPRFKQAQAARTLNALLANWEKSVQALDTHPGNNSRRYDDQDVALWVALTPRLQPTQVKSAWDSVIVILEKSKEESVKASAVLVALAPRLEPTQVERAVVALLTALEQPTDKPEENKGRFGLLGRGLGAQSFPTRALVALLPRLHQAQVKRAVDALLAILEKSNDNSWAASEGLTALAPRLEPAQAERAGDALVAILEKSSDEGVRATASGVLVALAPRLGPAQSKPAWDALVAVLEKSKDDRVRNSASKVLIALAPLLDRAQVNRAGDALIAILEKPKDKDVFALAAQVSITLAPRLEPAQAKRASDVLVAILEKSQDPDLRYSAWEVLVAVTPRLEAAQAKRAWDELVPILEKFNYGLDRDPVWPVWDPLVALVPRLEAAQAKRAGDALLAILEKSQDADLRFAASNALAALAPRLEPAQAKRAWDALMAILSRAGRTAPNTLAALAPRLEAAQVTRTANTLIAILEKSNDDEVRAAASQGLVALGPRLQPTQAKRASDAQVAVLEKSKDGPGYRALNDLAELAPRLEPAQAKCAWDAVMAILKKRAPDRREPDAEAAYEAFVALATRLEPASRDKFSTNAMTSLLDYSALFPRPYYDRAVDDTPDLRAILIARSISSPRSLAKLLSRPACVEELRQGLLHRFEELVFFDGKPMFGTADDASAFCAPEIFGGKQHRFHNLHDAAAWIQQNWPDFDLETSHPVTWPTEIHSRHDGQSDSQ